MSNTRTSLDYDNDKKAKDTMTSTMPEKETLTEMGVQQIEYVDPDVENAEAIASKEALCKTIRKMDLIMLPVMTTILTCCFIDRANIGLASVAGMAAELEIKGYQYSIALLVFFPGYALFVLPGSWVLQKTSVRYWLTFLSIGFGIFTLAAGLIPNYVGLVVTRVVLGIFEAGVYPSIITVVSSWYPRYYFGARMTTISCGASLMSSLSGVLAYAFSRINTANYAGWRWIFILEGIITVLVSVAAFFVLDEYPEKSKFLSAEQRDIATRLIAQDREEHTEDKVTTKLVLQALRD